MTIDLKIRFGEEWDEKFTISPRRPLRGLLHLVGRLYWFGVATQRGWRIKSPGRRVAVTQNKFWGGVIRYATEWHVPVWNMLYANGENQNGK